MRAAPVDYPIVVRSGTLAAKLKSDLAAPLPWDSKRIFITLDIAYDYLLRDDPTLLTRRDRVPVLELHELVNVTVSCRLKRLGNPFFIRRLLDAGEIVKTTLGELKVYYYDLSKKRWYEAVYPNHLVYTCPFCMGQYGSGG